MFNSTACDLSTKSFGLLLKTNKPKNKLGVLKRQVKRNICTHSISTDSKAVYAQHCSRHWLQNVRREDGMSAPRGASGLVQLQDANQIATFSNDYDGQITWGSKRI